MFKWKAIYEDGTHLDQGEYKDINKDKLIAFEIWSGDVKLLSLRFKKGQRLIWRRRIEMSPMGIKEVCHIIGKQETIDGKNYQGIIGLFESDGRMEVTGRFEEGHPWFYQPQIHKGEEWDDGKLD